MFSVESATDLAALRAVREPWQDLADAALEPNPFFHPGFFLPLLEELGWPPGMMVLLVWHEDRTLAALVPLILRRSGPAGSFAALRSVFLPVPMHVLLATPLLARERAPGAVDALLDTLDERRLPARVVELLGHAEDGPFAALLDERLSTRGQPSTRFAGIARPLLRPAASAELYLEAALGGRHRRELARQRRRLEQHGNLALVRWRSEEPLGPWIERFLGLEAAGWKGRAGTAMACDPRQRRFFERACHALARSGALEFLALELAGRPIAMACLLREAKPRGGAFVFKIAYDENYRRHSPGMQLLLEQLRRVHEADSPLGWIDSCASPRDTLYAQLWLDRRRLGHRLLAPRSLAGKLLISAVRAARSLRLSRAAPSESERSRTE
ncbi:MAG: GNAT family N-acetyltransferase [Geminicoccaceae bacterium]|nr:GNAT family N-acetyltransferase [Geminicoccaceae bacterium]MDW8342400.1 GNAT family N-acetyltransferase [Geminicoccaceae bacterium]